MKKVGIVPITVSTAIVVAIALVAWTASTPANGSKSLRDTMLNAVDHYSSVKAHYVHHFLGAAAGGTPQPLTVDILRQPGVGAAATLTRADGVVVDYVTDGKQMVEHDRSVDEYTLTSVAQSSVRQQALSIWQRFRMLFRKGKDAAPSVRLRREVTELPLGWAGTALFPQEWVLGTYDVAKVVDRGQQEMLSRSTQRLEVIAPNGRTFVVYVDKATGVLLRIEMSENGQVTDLVEATSFKVNVPVDRAKFAIPDLTGKRVRRYGG